MRLVAEYVLRDLGAAFDIDHVNHIFGTDDHPSILSRVRFATEQAKAAGSGLVRWRRNDRA